MAFPYAAESPVMEAEPAYLPQSLPGYSLDEYGAMDNFWPNRCEPMRVEVSSAWLGKGKERTLLLPGSTQAAKFTSTGRVEKKDAEEQSECSTADTSEDAQAALLDAGSSFPSAAAWLSQSDFHQEQDSHAYSYDPHEEAQQYQAWYPPMWTTPESMPQSAPQFGASGLPLGVPTVGSLQHETGHCKPCAFAWKEGGCQSGPGCEFCHMCPPGEKQRRKRVTRRIVRMESLRQSHTRAVGRDSRAKF